MRLLVLGGTHHVGRACVEMALARGANVTTLTRGQSGHPARGARALYADRTDVEALSSALGSDSWDAVLDTWSGAPRAVAAATRLLADRVAHYTYISSRSVYRWPIAAGADEQAPVVAADPEDVSDDDYAAAKRGGEIAVESQFAGRMVLARAGLIVGPYEIVGRLPWWLRRMERGGEVLAPGPRTRFLQYVDARDLASWVLSMAERGIAGTFNAVSAPGHTTMSGLLEACADATGSAATLVWASSEQIRQAGIAPWTELPIWVPPTGELAALHDADVTAALRAGLRCHPIEETVEDTWRWLRSAGEVIAPAKRAVLGLSAEREAAVLAALR